MVTTKARVILPILLHSVAASTSPVDDSQIGRVVILDSARPFQSITGTVRGYETVDYLLCVSAGEKVEVVMQTDNRSNYFNVMSPGAESAEFVGSTQGDTWRSLAEKDDYTIRVYLMRNAARRDELAHYTLSITLDPPGCN